jgi:hypothetical protein
VKRSFKTYWSNHMVGEVNFHSKSQWSGWAEYSVVAASLIAALAVLVGA